MNIKTMTVDELALLRTQDTAPYLLDVRTQNEYEFAQIEGAHLIPLQELAERTDEIPRDKALVIMCHHGVRSLHAAMYLETEGFSEIYNLSGGIDQWSRSVDSSVPLY
jgi:rhodanese-related sulfurtransferase